MLTVSDLDTFLHSPAVGLDTAIPVLPLSLIDTPGYPDRALFIASTPGGGPMLEGATDLQNFQFRWRGNEGDPQAAYQDTESIAKDTDAKIIVAAFPTTIGGRRVVRLYRTGGPPSYLAAIHRKVHFTCGYLFEAAAI